MAPAIGTRSNHSFDGRKYSNFFHLF
jgi:hypothetical protein